MITVSKSDFDRQIVPDDSPDTSYLEQAGFKDRLAEYRLGRIRLCWGSRGRRIAHSLRQGSNPNPDRKPWIVGNRIGQRGRLPRFSLPRGKRHTRRHAGGVRRQGSGLTIAPFYRKEWRFCLPIGNGGESTAIE